MIVLGRITAPYGVQGWVRIHPFGDDPLAWGRMKTWWLGRDPESAEGWREVALTGCREHSGSLIARFEGAADRTAAEALQGWYVAAPREALPATAPDEFYWADLVGLKVVNLAGEPLGSVRELIESGANHVLVVRDVVDENKERLLPFVGQVVKEVDVPGGTIRVDWGLDW